MKNNNNNNLITENKAPIEIVQELKSEYHQTYEEFMKTYESEEEVADSYYYEIDSYGDVRIGKRGGPMFNMVQLFQNLKTLDLKTLEFKLDQLDQIQILELWEQIKHLPEAGQLLIEGVKFTVEHSSELAQLVSAIGERIGNNASSSSSIFNNTISHESEYQVFSERMKDVEQESDYKCIFRRSQEVETIRSKKLEELEGLTNPFTERETYSHQFLEIKNWEEYVTHEKNLLPDESKRLIEFWANENPYPWERIKNDRVINPASKTKSPVWEGLKRYRDDIKTNGKTGKDLRYFRWDYTHKDIEVYNRRGGHLGSMDPITGDIYKGSDPENSISHLLK